MPLADFLSSLDSTPLFGEQEAVLKAIQEARGVREQLQQQPSLEAKLSALSNMSLSNGSKVSTAPHQLPVATRQDPDTPHEFRTQVSLTRGRNPAITPSPGARNTH